MPFKYEDEEEETTPKKFSFQYVDETPPTPAPVPSEPTNQYENAGVLGALFPATAASTQKGGNVVSRAVAGVGDVLTLPARGVSAAATGLGTLAGGGSVEDAMQQGLTDLSRTKSTESGALGVAQNIALDPMSSPLLFGAGTGGKVVKGAAGIVKAGLGGAAGAAGSAAYNEAQKGDIDVAEVGKQATLGLALGTGVGAIGAGLTKAAQKGEGLIARKIKQAVAEGTDLDRELLNATAESPAYLKRLKEAAISKGNGGFEDLYDNVIAAIDDKNAYISGTAQIHVDDLNAMMDDVIDRTTVRVKDAVQKAVAVDPSTVSQTAKGSKILDAVSEAEKSLGEAFGASGAENFGADITGLPLKARDVVVKAATKTAPAQTAKVTVLQDKLGQVFKDAGYDATKGFTGTEAFGNSAVTKDMIDDGLYFLKLSENADTIGKSMAQLRTLRASMGKPKGDGKFYDSLMLGKFDNKYVETITDALEEIPTESGKNLAQLWRNRNKAYATGIEALKGIKKTVNTSGKQENIIGNIKNLGTKKLLGIKKLAAENPDLAPVFDEIRSGFLEDIVARSADDLGNVDVKKFKTIWNSVGAKDTALKKTLLGEAKVADIDASLANFETVMKNISDTKRRVSTLASRTLADAKSAMVKKPSMSAIQNIGSKNLETAKKARETIKFLDEVYGTDFFPKAEDFWNAKRLHINEAGQLPIMPIQHTGKSLLGLVLAGSIKLTKNVPVVEPLAKAVVGMTGQSPSGALAIYRAVNHLTRAKKAVSGIASQAAFNSRTAPTVGLLSRGASNE